MELINLAILGLRLWDIIDILLVAGILYVLYNFLRGTVAINIFFGIVAIFLLWQIVDALNMPLLREILGAFVSVGFIALIVVFQPEIRKFLLMLGTPNFYHRQSKRFLFWKINFNNTDEASVDILVEACSAMGKKKTGALIILTRKNGLKQVLSSGERINADLGVQILESIFFKNNPLHDGAAIVTGNKIEAARCILPVSDNGVIPPHLGLRHRAAVGITEVSDAIALVVSEEKGTLTICENGTIHENLEVLAFRKKIFELMEIEV